MYIYMYAFSSRFIKECNTVSNASAYCRMADSADCGGDQRKSTQDQTRKLLKAERERKESQKR